MNPIILEKPGVGRIILRGCDEQKTTDDIISGILKYMKIAEGDGIIIGLSGGVDSSLTGVLCHKAMEQIDGRFFAMIMPSANNPENDRDVAIEVTRILGLEKKEPAELLNSKRGYCVVQIDDMMESFSRSFALSAQGLPYENTQSRIRMALLYAMKEASPGLRVVGTGNRDEDYGLGYFTKYGDGGVDFQPIAECPKRLVRALAAHNSLPEHIVSKIPSAGLRKDQTDCQDLGCGYFQAEVIVAGHDQNVRQHIVEIANHAGEHADLDDRYKHLLREINQEMVDSVLYRHEHLAPHKLNMPPIMKISFNY